MDLLKKFFEQHFRSPAEHVQPLQGELGGSGRKIVRLWNDTASAIGILYGVREENAAFLSFSKQFRRHGLPVPEIYGEDLDEGAYLEEDLGDTTLFEFLSQNRNGEKVAGPVIDAYRKVAALLPRFQVEAGQDLDYDLCYPCASFDRQSITWDLNYFKYIVPCGLTKPVCSLRSLGCGASREEVMTAVAVSFAKVFDFEPVMAHQGLQETR